MYVSSNLHLSPQLSVAAQYGTKLREKWTFWCIHVAKRATWNQNGLEMGTSFPFSTPNGFKSFFEKHIISPIVEHVFFTKWRTFKVFWELRGATLPRNGLQMDPIY